MIDNLPPSMTTGDEPPALWSGPARWRSGALFSSRTPHRQPGHVKTLGDQQWVRGLRRQGSRDGLTSFGSPGSRLDIRPEDSWAAAADLPSAREGGPAGRCGAARLGDGGRMRPAACSRPGQAGPCWGDFAAALAGRVDYQLGGADPPPAGVVTVTRDREAAPAPGTYGICYVNAFQTQPQETVWWQAHHPDLLLRDAGGPVGDPGWPGEVLLDLRTAQKRAAVASVVGGWVDGCAARGYRAVEPDNLDSWTRSRGLITRGQAVAFARLLTARGHRDHLAVAQKNTAELAPRGRAVASTLPWRRSARCSTSATPTPRRTGRTSSRSNTPTTDAMRSRPPAGCATVACRSCCGTGS